MRRALITGTAGFVGFHLAKRLLEAGWIVHGYDGMTDYYDVNLKRRRHWMLNRYRNFVAAEGMLEDMPVLQSIVSTARPEVIIHLAAQAGVRYSLENPRAYIDSNIVGTFNVMECAREAGVKHLLMASTSSVYGANTEMPFCEDHKTETPLTIYAATKKANEAMGHSFAHVNEIPVTMFRFFTVYGPWGRPDMALFKFVKGILDGTPIEIYNNGNMKRDFTYVEDLVHGIELLIDKPSDQPTPYQVVNIGKMDSICLLDFIAEIEQVLGRKAIRKMMPMQTGDVPATLADAARLKELTGYRPKTTYQEGVRRFVEWYQSYYNC